MLIRRRAPVTVTATNSASHRVVSRGVAGFTLVELVITIAVLSVALLGVAYSLQYSAQHGSDTLWQTKTVELAQAYSDEILSKRYDELTPVGGAPLCGSCSLTSSFGSGQDAIEEVRGLYLSVATNNFDDVDDYHLLDNNPPIDAQGAERSEYAGFRVQVSVSYAGTDLGLDSNENAKLIRIVITPPITPLTPVPFSFYRSNY